MNEEMSTDFAPSPESEEGSNVEIKPTVQSLKNLHLVRVGQTFEMNGVGLEVRKLTNKDIVCRPVYRVLDPR